MRNPFNFNSQYGNFDLKNLYCIWCHENLVFLSHLLIYHTPAPFFRLTCWKNFQQSISGVVLFTNSASFGSNIIDNQRAHVCSTSRDANETLIAAHCRWARARARRGLDMEIQCLFQTQIHTSTAQWRVGISLAQQTHCVIDIFLMKVFFVVTMGKAAQSTLRYPARIVNFFLWPPRPESAMPEGWRFPVPSSRNVVRPVK